jgi:dolichol-phosphate mannosyltransferase
MREGAEALDPTQDMHEGDEFSQDILSRNSGVRELNLSKDDITVILPVLNEQEAIGLVLDELEEEGYYTIMVVDGYSNDNTVKIAREKGVEVVTQHGSGKTGALMTAFDLVETPYLVVMDGDYSYAPGDIERLIPHALRYDQVLGCRRVGRENIGNLHRFGNWVINKTLNTLFGGGISDVCTGMYILRTDVAKGLDLDSGGFDAEVEMVINNLNSGRVTEVPISYRKRLGETKLSTWRQGFQILWTVVRMSFSHNPVFFLTFLGSLFAVLGGGILFHEFYLRWLYGESGWSMGFLWLGLVTFILGLNSFTIAMITLIVKRQERRILHYIRSSHQNEG